MHCAVALDSVDIYSTTHSLSCMLVAIIIRLLHSPGLYLIYLNIVITVDIQSGEYWYGADADAGVTGAGTADGGDTMIILIRLNDKYYC